MKNKTNTPKQSIAGKVKGLVKQDILISVLIASVALNLFAVVGYVLVEGTNDYGVVIYEKRG